MILLIDNYDSFTYNLFQAVGSIHANIIVARNDDVTLAMIEQMSPSHLILSPGPGRPEHAGICQSAIEHFYQKLPILGVCLGHQSICQVFGATVTYAQHLMHGKSSQVSLDTSSRLFQGLPRTIQAARYHSLIADPATVTSPLRVIATTREGEVMAVEHRDHPLFGVQFHPESILTPQGQTVIRNFLLIDQQTDTKSNIDERSIQ